MDDGLCSFSEFATEDRAVLQVHVDYISLNKVDEFRAACLRLLQTGLKHLIVDLRAVIRVPSGVLAAVIDTGMLAASGMGSRGQVTVLASRAVLDQFRRFENVGALQFQESEGEGRGGPPDGGTERTSGARLSAPPCSS